MEMHSDHDKEQPTAPHSGLGMISLVIAAIGFVLAVTLIFLMYFGSLKHCDEVLMSLLMGPWLALHAMGILVGLAARLQKITNLHFARVGVIGNILLIVVIITIVAPMYGPCR